MNLTQSPCCHHLSFSDAAMSVVRTGFAPGALERVAIAGEQAFKTNALRDILQCISGIVGGAALFSTSKLKKKWHYIVGPRSKWCRQEL